ncbi:WD repeat-containing protein 82 [Drosophila busckii]|uniref:WD repeat-containing protein 82 n=1 Tax=Drosophila busckii TaxID=30019 RepID=UPI001432BF07|nr:WD repeat-containing protein 82 [Drosophila busckii]
MKLCDNIMRQFGIAKSFQKMSALKQSMAFSPDGRSLAVCDHQSLTIYDCKHLKEQTQMSVARFLPEVVCYTQEQGIILHSETKFDCCICSLDLRTRRYVRLYRGHTQPVHTICFQPHSSHQFISAGQDDCLLLWDLRCHTYTHKLQELQQPLLAIDPAGLVFATSCGTSQIEIYDVRMLSRQPCQQYSYKCFDLANWTQLQFSPDGKHLLLSTDGSWCYSLDAFDGGLHQAYKVYVNAKREPLQACYTLDSQYVLAAGNAAGAGSVHVWQAHSGSLCGSCHSSAAMLHCWLPQDDAAAAEQQLEAAACIDLTRSDESDSDLELLDTKQLVNDDVIFVCKELLPKQSKASPASSVAVESESDSLEEGELTADD